MEAGTRVQELGGKKKENPSKLQTCCSQRKSVLLSTHKHRPHCCSSLVLCLMANMDAPGSSLDGHGDRKHCTSATAQKCPARSAQLPVALLRIKNVSQLGYKANHKSCGKNSFGHSSRQARANGWGLAALAACFALHRNVASWPAMRAKTHVAVANTAC